MRRTLNDLALGAMLALDRRSIVRLVLSAAGMGLAVGLLLLASAVPHALAAGIDGRDRHRSGLTFLDPRADPGSPAVLTEPSMSGDQLGMMSAQTKFRGRDIGGHVLYAEGPDSPVPPGLHRLPAPGESVLSPALARLLDSPDGELLRPRLPERRIGLIADEGLIGPHELYYYVGGPDHGEAMHWVGRFDPGPPPPEAPTVAVLWLMAAIGVTGLLVPVLVFVAATARIGAAARDRRLAAIRLVGADAAQARRIAAGEALVGGVAGVLVGGALFVLARANVEAFPLHGPGFFVEDVTPAWLAVVAIALGAPALAVVTAMIAMSRVVVEPLGVVRQAAGVPRRLSWRLLVIGTGIAILASLAGRFTGSSAGSMFGILAVLGVGLAIVGVPLLLPALVERVVRRLGAAGPPSWQLGVRGLQLDSGTSARVVGGVAAVLTAAIAAYALLASTATQFVSRFADVDPGTVTVAGSGKGLLDLDRAYRDLAGAQGVHDVLLAGSVTVSDDTELRNFGSTAVAPCPVLARLATLPNCRDGDMFVTSAQRGWVPRPGDTVQLPQPDMGDVGIELPIPASAPLVEPRQVEAMDRLIDPVLFVTPAALDLTTMNYVIYDGVLRVDPNDPDVVERARNAVAADRSVTVMERATVAVDSSFGLVREMLLIAALIGLGLAAASLLVLSIEQLRERRRALSMMVAAGCRRSTLAAAQLWQVALPMLLATGTAVLVGSVLGALLLAASGQTIRLDWVATGVLAGSAIALVLLVTAATLPTLRAATRIESLRTE